MPGWFDIFGLDATAPEDAIGFADSSARVHALIDAEVSFPPAPQRDSPFPAPPPH
jgi:hypothetical protein